MALQSRAVGSHSIPPPGFHPLNPPQCHQQKQVLLKTSQWSPHVLHPRSLQRISPMDDNSLVALRRKDPVTSAVALSVMQANRWLLNEWAVKRHLATAV